MFLDITFSQPFSTRYDHHQISHAVLTCTHASDIAQNTKLLLASSSVVLFCLVLLFVLLSDFFFFFFFFFCGGGGGG